MSTRPEQGLSLALTCLLPLWWLAKAEKGEVCLNRSETVPTEKEFRDAGHTHEAINYPLTDAEFVAKCYWNGLKDCTLAPIAWRYAPNQWCKDFWGKVSRLPSFEPQENLLKRTK